MSILRRLARRCETHDKPSYPRIRALEQDLDIEPSSPPDSIVDQFTDPDLIDCRNTWCTRRR